MEFDRNKNLGEGGCAVVYEGVWHGKPVAVKRIPTNKVASNEREEAALKMLNHQNIIKLFHVESDEDFR
jgi:serine/threonine-protein kinase/endoribonuclease IRE1